MKFTLAVLLSFGVLIWNGSALAGDHDSDPATPGSVAVGNDSYLRTIDDSNAKRRLLDAVSPTVDTNKLAAALRVDASALHIDSLGGSTSLAGHVVVDNPGKGLVYVIDQGTGRALIFDKNKMRPRGEMHIGVFKDNHNRDRLFVEANMKGPDAFIGTRKLAEPDDGMGFGYNALNDYENDPELGTFHVSYLKDRNLYQVHFGTKPNLWEVFYGRQTGAPVALVH